MSENFIRKIPAFLEKNENICGLNSHPLVAYAVQFIAYFISSLFLPIETLG